MESRANLSLDSRVSGGGCLKTPASPWSICWPPRLYSQCVKISLGFVVYEHPKMHHTIIIQKVLPPGQGVPYWAEGRAQGFQDLLPSWLDRLLALPGLLGVVSLNSVKSEKTKHPKGKGVDVFFNTSYWASSRARTPGRSWHMRGHTLEQGGQTRALHERHTYNRHQSVQSMKTPLQEAMSGDRGLTKAKG